MCNNHAVKRYSTARESRDMAIRHMLPCVTSPGAPRQEDSTAFTGTVSIIDIGIGVAPTSGIGTASCGGCVRPQTRIVAKQNAGASSHARRMAFCTFLLTNARQRSQPARSTALGRQWQSKPCSRGCSASKSATASIFVCVWIPSVAKAFCRSSQLTTATRTHKSANQLSDVQSLISM